MSNHEGMGMQDKAESAKHYRLRAEEVRAIAEGIFDHIERKTLMQIADEFEEMALKAEAREGPLQLANGRQKRASGADQKSRRNSN